MMRTLRAFCIVFVTTILVVASLALPSAASVKWTFRDIAFEGVGDAGPVAHEGGAVNCTGGALALYGCSFTNFVSRFSGGAVNAQQLEGDMVVSNCTFLCNGAGPFNGLGGAIYASSVLGVTANLSVTDSAFVRNTAENGGAIDTFHAADDEEDSVTLTIVRSRFEGNRAQYEGGAVFASGDTEVVGGADGTTTVFVANGAAQGGAIAVSGIPGYFEPPTLTLANHVVFADNCATNDAGWAGGGAVALLLGGSSLEADHVLFTNNYARSVAGNQTSLGGAVFTVSGTTNVFRKAAFIDNIALYEDAFSYGGAISVDYWGDEGEAPASLLVDTCVFDCGSAASENCFGNAIDLNTAETTLLNSSFRRGQGEAVTTYDGVLAVTNCVLVGNALAGGDDLYDLYVEGATRFSIVHSAFGSAGVDPAATIETNVFNLADCVPDSVYAADDTLRLRGDAFNPVAGLGLSQPGVTDFVETPYGSQARGTSMGAYETNALPLNVVVTGDKTYDGTTGRDFAVPFDWSAADESVENWSSYCGLDEKFAVTSWTYGKPDVGFYASTNAAPNGITAAISPQGGTEAAVARIVWLATLLEFVEVGTIFPETENLVVLIDPVEYVWTTNGAGVAVQVGPGITEGSSVVVSNMATHAILTNGVDYTLAYEGNVEPTDSAKIVVKGLGNYQGAETNESFAITAYLVAYYADREDATVLPWLVVTNGMLSGAEVSVAAAPPAGYCLDWQNSVTNGTVYVYDSALSEHDTHLLTLTVVCEKDVVGGDEGDPHYPGDGIPDKYQKMVLAKVVNGLWDSDPPSGMDKQLWVTMYVGEGESQRWAMPSEEGAVGVLGDAVPAVGQRPNGGYSKNGTQWLVIKDGAPLVIDDLGDYYFTSDTLPFALYAYLRQSGGHSGRGRGGEATTSSLTTLYGVRTEVTGLTLDSGSVKIGTRTLLTDATGQNDVAEIPMTVTRLKIYVSDTLDGEVRTEEVTTDEKGDATVEATGVSGFYRIGL